MAASVKPAGTPTGVEDFDELWRTRASKTGENIGFSNDSRWRVPSGIMADSRAYGEGASNLRQAALK
jgi:hypothetical protein